MAVRAVHAEHRKLGRLPMPERICELWAEAERRTYGKEKSDATIRSCEADEQSGGALVAESVERSVALKGKS